MQKKMVDLLMPLINKSIWFVLVIFRNKIKLTHCCETLSDADEMQSTALSKYPSSSGNGAKYQFTT